MSETENKIVERGMEIKSKLVIKDLGNPRAAAALPNIGDKVILGTVFGHASGTKATEIRGEIFIGITGNFEGRPIDPEQPAMRSGVVYLGGGFQEMIVSALKSAEGATVDFAYEVAAVRADNPIGYSYAYRPLLELKASSDPLANIIAEAEKKMKALAAPAASTAPKTKAA